MKKKDVLEASKDLQPQSIESVEEKVDSPPFITNIHFGLNAEEVQSRIDDGKFNGDQNIKTKSVGQILRENTITFFNFIFLVLAIILIFFVDFKGDFIGAIGNFGFMVLVIFNSLVGIFQELRAKRTIDKLSLISAPKARVLRSGEESEIEVKDILLDDMTILSSGSQICADAVVVEGSIEVNESLITGEPDAIVKNVGDHVMSGSFVVAGKAKAQVEHIGLDNFATKISAGAKYFKKPNSEIWRSLMLFVKIMASIIVPLAIALFCVKYIHQGNDLNETVISTIGQVIGMVPSGLVALTSTVFCVSVIRLSQHKTLAQDLYCVETLARVDVLCLDKTGTITEGTMEVNNLLVQTDKSEDDIKQIIKNVTTAIGDDNATANALKDFVSDFDVNAEAQSIVPFSSARKWSGARIDGVSYVIGAPEFVLPKANARVRATTEDMANKGYRVMVLAASTNDFKKNQLPTLLKLQCFIFISDKIRPEAPDTLRFFKEEGVTVKIISGDNPSTVRAVAMRAGLEDCENIIDMSTLTTEEEIKEAAEKYTIFGRVLPDQKLALVKALKEKGHTVAMTGDGVNDVLALKAADCSVAMASGSDAAKNVSSLVLLDSNFASMPRVVAEGRRSINNLERSAALYLMKTIYCTLIAILFLVVNDSLPFSPSNLTIMSMTTIGIPSVILALEPNKERVKGHFLPKVLSNAAPGGITALLAAVAVVLCNSFFLTDLTYEQTSTIFIMAITFVGFMLLFKVCLPLTWIHLALLEVMLFIFFGVYFIPLPNNMLLDFFHLNNNITFEMGMAILAICAVLVAIYVGMNMAMNAIKKHGKGRVDAAFDRLDKRMRLRQNKQTDAQQNKIENKSTKADKKQTNSSKSEAIEKDIVEVKVEDTPHANTLNDEQSQPTVEKKPKARKSSKQPVENTSTIIEKPIEENLTQPSVDTINTPSKKASTSTSNTTKASATKTAPTTTRDKASSKPTTKATQNKEPTKKQTTKVDPKSTSTTKSSSQKSSSNEKKPSVETQPTKSSTTKSSSTTKASNKSAQSSTKTASTATSKQTNASTVKSTSTNTSTATKSSTSAKTSTGAKSSTPTKQSTKQSK